MMRLLSAGVLGAFSVAILTATPVTAENHSTPLQGDVAAGIAAFERQCVSCHVVRDDEGLVLAGRRARSGPNLYAIAGRALGTVEGYRYSSSMRAAGEAGLIWSEDSFTGYVQDPKAWLKQALDDPKARAKMTFKVREKQDALDIYAFLVSLGPVVGAESD